MIDMIEQLNGFSTVLKERDAVGGVLLEIFAKTSLTYGEVAERTGLSRATVWDSMHGKKMPSVVVWAKIAECISNELIEEMEN